MSHRHQAEQRPAERIDDTIDRVAAHLTMVPADPSLAGRIAAQLDREVAFPWWRLAMASAAVAAVVAALALYNDARQLPAGDVAHHVISSPASPVADRAAQPADVSSESASFAPAVVATTRGGNARNAAPPAGDLLPEMPQLASLAPPVTIDVAVLPTDTLTIEPVDLAPLDVADLAVRAIAEADSPKE